MKKFKLVTLVFAIMLSATGLGLLFGAKQPAGAQAKVSADDEVKTVVFDATDTTYWQFTKDDSKKTITITGYTGGVSNVVDVVVPGKVDGYTVFIERDSNTGENEGVFGRNYEMRSITLGTNENEKVYGIGSLANMFIDDNELISCDLTYFDTSNVTNMHCFFVDCDNLSNLKLGDMNTSNVTDMAGMFEYCHKLTTLDLSSFDTQKVTLMQEMFGNCIRLTNLVLPQGFGSACENMDRMFGYCCYIKTLDLTNLDTSCATSIDEMFQNCLSLDKLILKDFYMRDAVKTSGQVEWDYDSLFSGMSKQQFDMFKAIYKIDLEYKRMKVPNIEYIAAVVPNNIFLNKFAESITALNFDGVGVGNDNSITKSTKALSSMNGLFKGCKNVTTLNLANFDTSNITDMHEMFKDCQRLKTLHVEGFNTSKVVDMSFMFYDVENVTKLDLSNFDTSKVQNMAGMFASLWGVTTIGYSENDDVVLGERFTTAKVTNVAGMFGDNVTLTTLDISKFDLSKLVAPTAANSLEGANMMLDMCVKLAKIKTPTAISQTVEIALPNGKWMEKDSDGSTQYQTMPAGDMTIVLIPNKYFAFNYVSDETYGDTLVAQDNGVADVFGLYDGDAYTIEIGMDETGSNYVMTLTGYIGSRSNVTIPAYVNVIAGEDMQITAIVKVACATDSTSFFGDKANNITSLKFGASVDPDNTTVKCNGLSKVLTGLSNLTTLDLNRLEITDGSEDLSNVFNDCGALKNIKMPKALKNTTTLNATGLKGLENWYYVASGSASLGQNVIGTNAISVYANNILSTDGSKTYEQLNKVFSGEADAPLTPSTGVVVDVILPVACITLVLANVCALAFAGKKKKQF